MTAAPDPAHSENRGLASSAVGAGGRVWRFGAGTVRRIAAGRKRAAVVSAPANPDVRVGEVVTVTTDGADGRVPIRLVGVGGPAAPSGIGAAAEAAGVALSDVTVLRSWDTYFRTRLEKTSRAAAAGAAAGVAAGASAVDAAERAADVAVEVERSGPFWVVSFETAGAVSGTVPERGRPTPKKKKAPPPPPKPKPAPVPKKKPKVSAPPPTPAEAWQVVEATAQAATPVRPGTRLHPVDVTTVQIRFEQVVGRLQPPPQTRQAVSRLVDALLEERVCGPAGLSPPTRARLRADLGRAVAWMDRNKLLVAGAAWNPRLLVGMRIHATAAGPVTPRVHRLRKVRGKFQSVPAVLQHWYQTGLLTSLDFRDDGTEGPTHAPTAVFTAIATLPDGGGVVERAGRAPRKKYAYRDAADNLALALTDRW